MDLQTIALWITSGISVAGIVGWLFRKDTKGEQRKEVAMDLKASLEKLGLTRLAALAGCYIKEDWSGGYVLLKALAEDLAKEGGADLLLAESFFKQLPNRLKLDDDRPKILKAIADFQLVNPAPVAPVAVK